MDNIISNIYTDYLIIKNKKDEMGHKLTRDFALKYMNKRKESYEKINKVLAEKNINPSFFFKNEINNSIIDFDIVKIRFLIGYLKTFKPRLIDDELTEALKVCTNNYFDDITGGCVVGAMEDIVDFMHLFKNTNVTPVVKQIKEIAEKIEPYENIHTVLDKVLHVMPDTEEAFNLIKSFNKSHLLKYFENTLNHLINYYKEKNLIDEGLNWIG